MAALATLFLIIVQFAAISRPAASRRQVPAIYVFGDSMVDVGNNNWLPGNVKANYRPYGIDYSGSIPTGRFCNGYVGVDFIAQRLGFKESPPSALAVEGFKTAAEESRGLNYASAGSGVLDDPADDSSISLNSQIGLFRETVGRLVRTRGRKHADIFLSRSLFVFNTFNNNILSLFPATTVLDAKMQQQLISNLTAEFGQKLQSVYNLGARKLVVFGTGQLGCAPFLRLYTPNLDCVDLANVLSRKLNVALRNKMRALSSELRDLQYSYINTYEIFGEILSRAKEFGFTELKTACCGGGLLNAEIPCNPNSTYCSDRDAYLLWDWAHFTQATYKRIIDLAYSGLPRFVEPISLDDLVRRS